mgnify:CR=1 FL=1
MKYKFMSAVIIVVLMCSCAWADVPSVTMLSTKTCPACRQMQKVFAELRQNYPDRISTSYVYLEDNPYIAEQYKVRYVPVLIFRDAEGNELAQEIGYRSANDVIKIFMKAGINI